MVKVKDDFIGFMQPLRCLRILKLKSRSVLLIVLTVSLFVLMPSVQAEKIKWVFKGGWAEDGGEWYVNRVQVEGDYAFDGSWSRINYAGR